MRIFSTPLILKETPKTSELLPTFHTAPPIAAFTLKLHFIALSAQKSLTIFTPIKHISLSH